MGNIISVNENGKQHYKYGYDKLGRIILEKDLYNGTEVCYTYDNNGNILTKSENGTVKEYKYYEGTDRLASYNGENCEYDAAGNPTKYRNLSFEWSKGRQLTRQITKEGKTVEYTYDGSGLRRTKTSDGVTKTYDYENGRLVRESGGEKPVRFLYGEGGIIGIKLNKAKFLFRKNAFGDVTEIYNAEGELVAKYNYSAYGKCEIKDSQDDVAKINPIRYRGYYYDEETGLYYLKSRYYDPETGRFLNADDISVLDTTSNYPNGLNLYAYCFNDPVNACDDEGNMANWLKWLIGGLAFVGAVALTVLSGGSLAPVFIGMGISIIGGGLIQGTMTALNGGSFWQGFANGAADGAFWGGVFALGGAVVRTARILKNGVVIGESMSRVEAAAKQVGALTYQAPGKNIVKILGRAKAFEINKALNKAWIKRMVRWGVKIYDIGLDLTRISRSPFYAIEAAVTAGFWNLIKMLF